MNSGVVAEAALTMIHILAIGKKHEDWIQPDSAPEAPTSAIRTSPGSYAAYTQDDQARQEEFERYSIASRRAITSSYSTRLATARLAALTTQLEQHFSRSRQPTIIIGGAYGVTDELRDRADLVLSLSSLVFPATRPPDPNRTTLPRPANCCR